ncbi:NAD(P)-dependent dehydrogenase (short-subunit alcohol dehydrogenase family) [Novosphingobium hassiacum]|uniref:NAD(P)-dependent dehydrogenase (Short-subunit alcohol dehydrogenase family) n=1 Tax=Novosphingobium hassiacum TaxID=173676 RepID=A0A7W6EXY8_9SPHN|nr:NAD(P)-dependent dehydrogenase (short-subunit alcohol dehydrogenase family) [Novosphingobium hassiacum]
MNVDITDPASVKGMIDQTIEAFGALNVLVNNAALFGALRPGPFDQIASAEWDRVMSVSTRGPFECIKAAIPHLRRAAGSKIINVASTTPYMGQPMMLHYVTSKGAIIALTHALARELGSDGICVNALAPGLTMSEAVRQSFTQDRVDANVAVRALMREQLPDDLVGGLVFLASRESDFMTGQTLVIDGGVILK